METTATKRIEALYQIRGDDVFAFIEQHPFLVPILLEAPAQIKPYFPESPLALEMFIDPEGIGVRSLLIVIPTRLDVDTAFEKFNQIHDDLWFQRWDETQHKLDLYMEMVSS